MAYSSNESGRYEVYLGRFPSGEGRRQVSAAGGRNPRWSPEGDELFWSYDGKLMVADGERFLMIARKEENWEADSNAGMLMLVENWVGP